MTPCANSRFASLKESLFAIVANSSVSADSHFATVANLDVVATLHFATVANRQTLSGRGGLQAIWFLQPLQIGRHSLKGEDCC